MSGMTCPKCAGWWNAEGRDEHGEADPHCVACGYRVSRPPTALEMGKDRKGGSRRKDTRAQHGGVPL